MITIFFTSTRDKLTKFHYFPSLITETVSSSAAPSISCVLWVSCDSDVPSTLFGKFRRTVLSRTVLRRSVLHPNRFFKILKNQNTGTVPLCVGLLGYCPIFTLITLPSLFIMPELETLIGLDYQRLWWRSKCLWTWQIVWMKCDIDVKIEWRVK